VKCNQGSLSSIYFCGHMGEFENDYVARMFDGFLVCYFLNPNVEVHVFMADQNCKYNICRNVTLWQRTAKRLSKFRGWVRHRTLMQFRLFGKQNQYTKSKFNIINYSLLTHYFLKTDIKIVICTRVRLNLTDQLPKSRKCDIPVVCVKLGKGM
jgi:hypothetical protein